MNFYKGFNIKVQENGETINICFPEVVTFTKQSLVEDIRNNTEITNIKDYLIKKVGEDFITVEDAIVEPEAISIINGDIQINDERNIEIERVNNFDGRIEDRKSVV